MIFQVFYAKKPSFPSIFIGIVLCSRERNMIIARKSLQKSRHQQIDTYIFLILAAILPYFVLF